MEWAGFVDFTGFQWFKVCFSDALCWSVAQSEQGGHLERNDSREMKRMKTQEAFRMIQSACWYFRSNNWTVVELGTLVTGAASTPSETQGTYTERGPKAVNYSAEKNDVNLTLDRHLDAGTEGGVGRLRE